jgi:FG-GAP-like repeat
VIRATPQALARKSGAVVVSFVAALCLTADLAHASIAADFNGDGVLDAVVVLPHPSDTNIVIQVSGATPQILKLSGRVISIVAVDVDHDGTLDLSALSERRGLFVWLNKAGHGRFAALKRHRARRGFQLSRRAHTSATQPGENEPAASGDQVGVPDADAPRAGPVFDAPPGAYTVLPTFSACSADLGKSSAPRGPPSPTLTD